MSGVSHANTMLYGIPKDIYTSDGEKVEKTKDWLKNTPFINQSEDSILI
jgi:hypothetical protein